MDIQPSQQQNNQPKQNQPVVNYTPSSFEGPQKPNKKVIITVVIVLLLLAAGAGAYWYFGRPGQIACTLEAKLCPDGSYVGRTGPNCEFTECPAVSPVPSEVEGWQTYRNEEYGFEVKYPAKFKAAEDKYGWPNSIALFISPSGQYYIIQIEIWDTQEGFRNLYKKDPFFIIKTRDGKKHLTINYLADETDEKDCQTLITTFKFTK